MTRREKWAEHLTPREIAYLDTLNGAMEFVNPTVEQVLHSTLHSLALTRDEKNKAQAKGSCESFDGWLIPGLECTKDGTAPTCSKHYIEAKDREVATAEGALRRFYVYVIDPDRFAAEYGGPEFEGSSCSEEAMEALVKWKERELFVPARDALPDVGAALPKAKGKKPGKYDRMHKEGDCLNE